jgi:NAD(P)-dependent dehydrogenase (short-subunit alcohol dehydrogenase family)
MDLTEFSEAAWQTALLTGPDRPQQVDVFVNLAVPPRGGAIGELSPAEFHRIIEQNYVRTFLALKYGVQLLRQSNGGLFINVTSGDGKPGSPGTAARGAVSMGVRMMTQCAALECAAKKDKVRVNAVLAGDIVEGNNVKLGQVGLKDVANAVAFFAADASSYLTGYLLPVANGGAV